MLLLIFLMKQTAIKYACIYSVYGLLWLLASSYLLQRMAFDSVAGFALSFLICLLILVGTALLLYSAISHASRKVLEKKNQYKRLFEENPNPMWVYDLESLQILAVNAAALQTYGYRREEFLNMTILQLSPEKEGQRLLRNLGKNMPIYANSGSWLHKKKSGEEFYVNVYSHRTQFNKRKARLVLAQDITDQLIAEEWILLQNRKLREIAHLQSHNVRRPVASIMGLVGLFDKNNLNNEINTVVIEKLNVVCKELDSTIHKIVKKTYELEIGNAREKHATPPSPLAADPYIRQNRSSLGSKSPRPSAKSKKVV